MAGGVVKVHKTRISFREGWPSQPWLQHADEAIFNVDVSVNLSFPSPLIASPSIEDVSGLNLKPRLGRLTNTLSSLFVRLLPLETTPSLGGNATGRLAEPALKSQMKKRNQYYEVSHDVAYAQEFVNGVEFLSACHHFPSLP